MYLPEGNVMPAYSTWQPTEGKIPPTASADQSATRRRVAPRGDPMRGNPIASTLLGFFGGRSDRFFERVGPPWGIQFLPAQPDQVSIRMARPGVTRGTGPLGRTVRSSGFLLSYQIDRIDCPSPMIPPVSTESVATVRRSLA
jgi:hypothetical protein